MTPTDKAEMFARRIVSLIFEGGTKGDFDADVVAVTIILREFAASRVNDFLDRVEQHAGEIYVREIIDGKRGNFRNVSLRVTAPRR